MLSKRVNFITFKQKPKNFIVKKNLDAILKENNEILKSLSKKYKNSFKKIKLNKYLKFLNFRIIGMGGSSLGSQAIYNFLKYKIKKNFIFIDNLQTYYKPVKKLFTNLIISKSGNTIETISNAQILIKKKIKIYLLLNKEKVIYFF